MPKYRRERAGDFIKEELTLMLRNSVADPRVQGLIITDVNLTRDRHIARVFVACYDGDDALKEGLEGLEHAKGFLRHELSQLLPWRFCPEVEFRADRSWQQGSRIDALLGSLGPRDTQGQP